MRYTKYLFFLTAISLILFSCSKKTESDSEFPDNKVRIHVEEIVNDDTLLVYQILVTAKGDTKISISEDGISVSPNSQNKDLMEATITVVADLLKGPKGEARLRWYVKNSSGGATVVSSSIVPAADADKILDVVQFQLESGEYDRSKSIDFSSVMNKNHQLLIE